MSSKLLKRKESTDTLPDIDPEDAQSIFQRHFEAQFAPLSPPPQREVAQVETDEEEDSEWGGLSDGENDSSKVQIIDHTGPAPRSTSTMSKRELKEFMV